MTNDNMVQVLVSTELIRARAKYNTPFHSYHEGKAIIEEEFDELWDEIKKQTPDPIKIKTEAIQLAAMVERFIGDLT